MAGPDTFVRIPKERVGILIGPEGKVKQYIEDKLHVKLEIDSEGSVTITLAEERNRPIHAAESERCSNSHWKRLCA